MVSIGKAACLLMGRREALFNQLNASGEPSLFSGIALGGSLFFLQFQVG